MTITKLDARLARLAARATALKAHERDVLARAKASVTLPQAARRTDRHERVLARIARVADEIKTTKYRMNCTQFGLAPEWLGKSFDTPRGKLTIIGLAPRRAKCVMLRDDANQRLFCLPAHARQKLATTEAVRKTARA